MNRRSLLKGSLALAAGLILPVPASAELSSVRYVEFDAYGWVNDGAKVIIHPDEPLGCSVGDVLHLGCHGLTRVVAVPPRGIQGYPLGYEIYLVEVL